MNIGVVVDNEYDFDIRVKKEVRFLSKKGYNVFVLCFDFGKNYATHEGITVERIKLPQKLKNILFVLLNRFPIYELMWARRIKKFVKKNSINILHAHDLYMSKASFNGLKKGNENVSLILDLHENYPAAIRSYNWTQGTFRNWLIQPKKWEQKERAYLSYPDKIVVLSASFESELIQKHPSLKSKQFVVYPNVVDLDEFDQYEIDYTFKKKKYPTLFYFGVVAERRGIFDALDVFKELIKQGEKLNLLIIGPVDKADQLRFQTYLEDSELTDYLEYIAWVDISNLTSYLNIVDICLAPFHKNPQHESGIANKIFQYMYGKKPLIVSNCKPQQELIESANCGRVYSNLEEFKSVMIELINSKTLREELGKNGHDVLIRDNSSYKYEKELLKIYEN